MSVRFGRAVLAVALVVPVVCAVSPAVAGAAPSRPRAARSIGSSAVVDVTDPTVTLTTPSDGATFPRFRSVDADFACADEVGGSGIASCVGTVDDGEAVDTSTLGDHDFTVTASDVAGNTTAVTHTYTVARARPDARIRRGTGVTVGNDVYAPHHLQRVTASVLPGGSVTYYVTVQNDATFAERLRLRTQRTFYFIVRYFNPAGGDITHEIIAARFLTPRLTPGQIFRVRMVVTIPRDAPLRMRSMPAGLGVVSTTHHWMRDGVGAVTRRA